MDHSVAIELNEQKAQVSQTATTRRLRRPCRASWVLSLGVTQLVVVLGETEFLSTGARWARFLRELRNSYTKNANSRTYFDLSLG